MEILIENRQRRRRINPEKLKTAIRKILNALASEPVELSVLLVDDEYITRLNRQYLNRAGPTNVISFPMREGESSELHTYLLGDVVVSVDTAEREAQKFSQSFEKRLHFLLIHGILHLFGYDHEQSEADAEKMENETERLMDLISPIIND